MVTCKYQIAQLCQKPLTHRNLFLQRMPTNTYGFKNKILIHNKSCNSLTVKSERAHAKAVARDNPNVVVNSHSAKRSSTKYLVKHIFRSYFSKILIQSLSLINKVFSVEQICQALKLYNHCIFKLLLKFNAVVRYVLILVMHMWVCSDIKCAISLFPGERSLQICHWRDPFHIFAYLEVAINQLS